jgi:hydrogenase nickel incorporation protein HypA/HybF
MHEVGIMQSTLEAAEKQARAAGAARIHEIRMRVGRMRGVVPEALEHAFAILREGTMAAAATLSIEHVMAACWCGDCRQEFECPDWFSECPTCGTPSNDLRRGLELELVSMEVD